MREISNELKEILSKVYELRRDIEIKEATNINYEAEIERWKKLNKNLQQMINDIENSMRIILDKIKEG